MFADKAEIIVQAGKGGDGRLSFRHEKLRARGGPDGGDGGRGGSVVLVADHNMNTLSKFRSSKRLRAEDGQMGGADRKHGKNGEDVMVPVPVGTQVHDGDQLITDLSEAGQMSVIAKGGKGGFGNAHFTSSTRQAPRSVEVGEAGENRVVTLEMKMVADVGLVGLPNAGKSTLLSVISNAKPEIADYPFTTIIPNLGVVDWRDSSFLVADIPGLIEGASLGKGLGDEFLRHIERTAVLIHLVDVNSADIVNDYKTIQNELEAHDSSLSQKPQLVVLSKADLLPDMTLYEEPLEQLREASSQKEVYVISATAHKGLDKLLDQALDLVKKARQIRSEEVKKEEIPVIDETSQPGLWQVIEEDGQIIIKGEKIEGFARRTSWNQGESVERLRDIMRKQGISKDLARRGVRSGDMVKIAGHKLEWQE